MQIAVDARQVYRSQRRGIGKTLIPLYRTLASLRSDWQFDLYHQSDIPVPELNDIPNIRHIACDFLGADRFDWWERLYLPATTWFRGGDVFHAPANTSPRFSRIPVVVNIHDLIPYEMAPDDPRSLKWLQQVRRAAHRSSHILTGSEYSKSRITTVIGVPPEKITVNPWAPDPCMIPVTDFDRIEAIRVRYGLQPRERYLFAFGAADPRKNTRRLIEAYAQLSPELQNQVRLLIVGIQDDAITGFQSLIASLGITHRVNLHGYAPEQDLPVLLSAAEMLCFPSQTEGFGLPILDAFVCGTAVISGDRTSMPEVVGDAALMIDPNDTTALRDAMTRLLQNEEYRQSLVRKGKVRAKLFTWASVAEGVARVFEQVVSQRRRAQPCRP